MTKVINLSAGPGSGKSTIASDLFALMKWKNINCELVGEYAKDLTYEQHFDKMKDQLYLFAKQNRKLERLRDKVDYIITDSPLLLVLVYQPPEYYAGFEPFVRQVWNSYDNINFFIRRKKSYHAQGRSQTEEQAKALDQPVIKLFDASQGPLYFVDGDEHAKHSIARVLGIE